MTHYLKLFELQRVLFALLLLVGLVPIGGCSGIVPAVAAADSATIPVALNWLASCEPASGRIFSIDLATDHSVEFRGHDGVREVGTKTVQLTRKQVSGISSSAISARSKYAKNADGRFGLANARYCIEVVENGRAIRLVPVFQEDVEAGGLSLEKKVRAAIDLKSLLCPSRVDALFGAGYCDTYAISLVWTPPSGCSPSHILHLFDDGTLHYFRGGVPESDVYLKVDTGALLSLREMTSRFTQGFQVSSGGGADKRPAREIYKYFDGEEELASFEKRLTELTRFAWTETAPANCVRERRPGPQRTLSVRQ